MKLYIKDILPHQEFYISRFIKNIDMPYLLFIHGGPGLNCGVIEYLIEHNNLFNKLNCNIILYDQRNCGRSKKNCGHIKHQDNVNDLKDILSYLNKQIRLKIHALIGHSYGAKLLYDYYKSFTTSIPGIFISTASSILIPRLNNILLDLSYLKKTNPNKYNNMLDSLQDMDLKKIWEISEELNPLFQENPDRLYLYWANLDYLHLIQNIQKNINLPLDLNTFTSIRKDLYSNESNFSVDIDTINISKLWINGFHDFIMNGQQNILYNNSKITTFYKSSHYPHIEENDRFSELLNEFIKKL